MRDLAWPLLTIIMTFTRATDHCQAPRRDHFLMQSNGTTISQVIWGTGSRQWNV
jgi:hypothetical protein